MIPLLSWPGHLSNDFCVWTDVLHSQLDITQICKMWDIVNKSNKYILMADLELTHFHCLM